MNGNVFIHSVVSMFWFQLYGLHAGHRSEQTL